MSQNLFHLVKSLSPSEKRYFNLLASMQGKSSNYLRLLNAISNQEEYDEKKLMVKFRKETFVKHFAVTKNYLYKLILKSLSIYYGNVDQEGKILDGIKTIKALLIKGRVGDAAKNWNKINKQAEQLELYEIQLVLLRLEEEIQLASIGGKQLERFYSGWYQKYQHIQDVIQQKLRVKRLWEDFRKTYISSVSEPKEKILAKLNQILADKVIENKEALVSSDAHHYYYMMYIVLALRNNDLKEARLIAFQQLEWIESNDQVCNYRPKIYYTALHAYLRTQAGLHDFEDYNYYLDIIKAMPATHEKLLSFQHLADVFCFQYNALLLREHQLKKTETILKEEEEFLRGLSRYQDHMDAMICAQILFGFLNGHFRVFNWERCLDWSERVVSHTQRITYHAVLESAHLIKIIAHYELGHFQLSLSLIRSFKRKFFSETKVNIRYKIVLDYLMKLISGKVENQSLFLGLKAALEEHPAKIAQQKYLYFIDLDHWVMSKIED